jgi:hypothetical protein
MPRAWRAQPRRQATATTAGCAGCAPPRAPARRPLPASSSSRRIGAEKGRAWRKRDGKMKGPEELIRHATRQVIQLRWLSRFDSRRKVDLTARVMYDVRVIQLRAAPSRRVPSVVCALQGPALRRVGRGGLAGQLWRASADTCCAGPSRSHAYPRARLCARARRVPTARVLADQLGRSAAPPTLRSWDMQPDPRRRAGSDARRLSARLLEGA